MSASASIRLLVLLGLATCSSVGAQGAAAASDDRLAAMVCRLHDSVGRFWLEHGINSTTGGPVGTVGRDGSPLNLGSWTTDVGLIQTARLCYGFYNFALRGHKAQENAAAGRAMCAFMLHKMRSKQQQPNTPPGLLVFAVIADGSRVTDSSVNLMGQMTAVLALAQQALYLKTPASKAEVLSQFAAVDAWAHDRTAGGYSESASRPRLDSFLLPDNKTASVSTNTHVTAITALAALYKATGDATVRQRLLELLAITCDRLLPPPGTKDQLAIAYDTTTSTTSTTPGNDASRLGGSTTGSSWRPVGSAATPVNTLRYGSQLQLAWVVADTLKLLAARGDVAAARAAACTAKMMRLADRSLQLGYDSQHGGVAEFGLLPAGRLPGNPQQSTQKLWFDQLEALNALWWLNATAASAADRARYSGMLQQTLRFVVDKQLDARYGELYWSTDASGTPLQDQYGRGLFKGSNWKANFHSSRMVLNFVDWLPVSCSGKPARVAAEAGR